MFRAALLLPLPLVACPQPVPTDVRSATAAEVAGCEYVKNISTTPGVFGPLAQAGLEDARNAALRSAAASGANTVVFDEVEPGAPVYRLEAVAYRC
ncbi:MAG: hypothetical protein QNJ13_05355 [Paracoccaceae bacterium]|nr:hypothetical protein [Paracoccaceae bacterium]